MVALLPESRATERPGLDPLGVLSSSAGLVGVTYGLIAAGQHGWGATSALLPLGAGAVTLVAFVLWERWLSQRPGGQPLIPLVIFRSPSFTWGTLLAGAGNLTIVGLLFTIPQYFQAILGADAQGAGLRLLPLIAGLVLGAVPADRLAARIGAKFAVALGFALLAAGLTAGATTGVGTGDGFAAVWTAVCGAGVGLALATATSRALAELSAERSGVGSAVMQAVQKLGSPFGAAILGSALNATYRSQARMAGVPASAIAAVKTSVFTGVTVAHQLRSAALLHAVRGAFVAGMDSALGIAAGIALAGLVLALLFLPQRSGANRAIAAAGVELEHEGVA